MTNDKSKLTQYASYNSCIPDNCVLENYSDHHKINFCDIVKIRMTSTKNIPCHKCIYDKNNKFNWLYLLWRKFVNKISIL